MALDKEVVNRAYSVATADLMAFLNAGAGESVYEVDLTDKIRVTTVKVGPATWTYRDYSITLTQARTSFGVGTGESFLSVSFSGGLTIMTFKRTI